MPCALRRLPAISKPATAKPPRPRQMQRWPPSGCFVSQCPATGLRYGSPVPPITLQPRRQNPAAMQSMPRLPQSWCVVVFACLECSANAYARVYRGSPRNASRCLAHRHAYARTRQAPERNVTSASSTADAPLDVARKLESNGCNPAIFLHVLPFNEPTVLPLIISLVIGWVYRIRSS